MIAQRRGWIGAVTAAALGAALGQAAPALADPGQGGGLSQLGQFTCTGAVNATITPVGPQKGAVGFVDGTVYLIMSITGTAPDGTVVFTKTYGQRNGAGPATSCVGTEPGSGLTLHVVVAPAPGTA